MAICEDPGRRSLEWYWKADDTMPCLDIYEALPFVERTAFLAAAIHWCHLRSGERPLESRVAFERSRPVIVAIKAGKHRFAPFKEAQGPTWIVCGHYLKEGRNRDKTGDRIIDQAVRFRANYIEAVIKGIYYERD